MRNVWEIKYERIGGCLKPTAFINLATQNELDPDGYNYRGFNEEGYDREGYDRDGYDKEGYDRGGYDKEGYDKEGYDRDGYGKDGYDRDGYDRNGKDENGLSREEKERQRILELKNMNERQCPYCVGEGYVYARDGAKNGIRITYKKMCNKCLGTGEKGHSPYL